MYYILCPFWSSEKSEYYSIPWTLNIVYAYTKSCNWEKKKIEGKELAKSVGLH